MSQVYDPALKALVEAGPSDWVALITGSPDPVEILEADVATVSGAADKVLRVRTDPEWLLHLEFHSGHDGAQLPSLLQVRNALMHHRHALPVRSVVMVLKPDADSPRLNGRYEQQLPNQTAPYCTFDYEVRRVWEMDPESLLRGGLGTLPLAPIANVTEEQVPGIINQMKRRVARHRNKIQYEQVWISTFILMGLRYSSAFSAQLLQGVLSMKESTTYQAIIEEGRKEGRIEGLEEGREKGREEGREKGLEEGREEGELRTLRETILDLGTQRFGAPSATIRNTVEGQTEVARLREIRGRVLTATDWQDLLSPGQPTPRRRGRRGK